MLRINFLGEVTIYAQKGYCLCAPPLPFMRTAVTIYAQLLFLRLPFMRTVLWALTGLSTAT